MQHHGTEKGSRTYQHLSIFIPETISIAKFKTQGLPIPCFERFNGTATGADTDKSCTAVIFKLLEKIETVLWVVDEAASL